MFGIGMTELMVIFIVVLIFFGPKRLPELAKALGRGIAEFRKAANEVRNTVETDIHLDDQSPKTVDKELLSPTSRLEKNPAAVTDNQP